MDIQIHDKTYHYTEPKSRLNQPDGKLVLLNVDIFEAYYKKCGDFYLHANNGKNSIEGRYERFERFLETTSTIEASYVVVAIKDDRLVVDFVNGRHRYAVLRDKGIESLPVYMHPESIQLAQKAGLLKDESLVLNNVIIANFPHKEKYQKNESLDNVQIVQIPVLEKPKHVIANNTNNIASDTITSDFTSYYFQQGQKNLNAEKVNQDNNSTPVYDIELLEDIPQYKKDSIQVQDDNIKKEQSESAISENQFALEEKSSLLNKIKNLRHKVFDANPNKQFKL